MTFPIVKFFQVPGKFIFAAGTVGIHLPEHGVKNGFGKHFFRRQLIGIPFVLKYPASNIGTADIAAAAAAAFGNCLTDITAVHADRRG